jgi:hypothetical protein
MCIGLFGTHDGNVAKRSWDAQSLTRVPQSKESSYEWTFICSPRDTQTSQTQSGVEEGVIYYLMLFPVQLDLLEVS